MNQPSHTPGKLTNTQTVRNLGLFSVGAQVGCVTLVIVFLSLFIGLGLDKLLGTRPIFTIIFILGSAPAALYLTFWIAMRAVKNLNPQDGAVLGSPEPVKEEQKRE
jgi:F0F1-type ATP synthase assembly protein I